MSELLKIYECLCASGTQIVPPNAVVIKESLYGNLTVLDSKASALMAFDGILIAIASFTIQQGGVFASEPLVPLVVIILTLLGAGCCLFVAQVSYPFFGKVIMTSAKLDFSSELGALASAVTWRTNFYRAAWWLSAIAVALFLIVFVLALGNYL
jgi:hypothetical protein